MSTIGPPNPPPGFRLYPYHDPFEDYVGPLWLKEEAGGELSFAFQIQEKHCNAGDTLHGGMLMTFADFALCAIACWDVVEQERAITVSFQGDFVAAGNLGDLVEARGEIVRRTRTLTFVRALIRVGDKTLMSCSAVMKRFERNRG